MKSSHILLLSLLVLLIAAIVPQSVGAQASFPRLTSVTPDTGKVGDQLTVEGENLDKASVKDLYLTDGQTDYKMQIVEQSATSIQFKIPASAKPGRFNLMVLTGGAEPRLIEQPVKVNIEG
jgi:hypothetical protein